MPCDACLATSWCVGAVKDRAVDCSALHQSTAPSGGAIKHPSVACIPLWFVAALCYKIANVTSGDRKSTHVNTLHPPLFPSLTILCASIDLPTLVQTVEYPTRLQNKTNPTPCLPPRLPLPPPLPLRSSPPPRRPLRLLPPLSRPQLLPLKLPLVSSGQLFRL